MSTLNVGTLNESISIPVASASQIDPWKSATIIPVTGTTSITSFTPAPKAGAHRILLAQDTFDIVDSANFVVTGGTHTIFPGDMVDIYAETTTKFLLITKSFSKSSTASAGINFENGQFDSHVIGWSTYRNITVPTAAVPETGTGGTAAITFGQTTSLPLIGTGSGLLTKTAPNGNRVGDGVSYDFTVDLGARNDPLKLTFEYLTDANYVSGDIGCYIYDITNATLLYPSIVNIPASGALPAKFESSLWLNANSGSYRLIFHVQSTSASAYTFKLDNIQVEPLIPSLGAVISEWKSYTPTITNLGAGSYSSTGSFRRNGSNLDFRGSFTKDGTAGTGVAIVKCIIPNGMMTVETPDSVVSGSFTSLGIDKGTFILIGGELNSVAFRTLSSALLGSNILANAKTEFSFSIPISQWTSNINLAGDFTEYASNSDYSANSETSNSTYWTHSSAGELVPNITTSTEGTIEKIVDFYRPVQESDIVVLEVKIPTIPVWTQFGALLTHSKQGTYEYGMYLSLEGSRVSVTFGKGGYSPTGATYASASANLWSVLYSAGWRWRVRKISNGNTAEVPPVVACRVESITAMTDLTTGTNTTIPYSTVALDTHNRWNPATSVYTIPVSGHYQLNASVLVHWAGYAGGCTNSGMTIATSNGSVTFLQSIPTVAFVYLTWQASKTIYLKAGETVSVYAQQDSGTTRLMHSGNPSINYLTITRIGG